VAAGFTERADAASELTPLVTFSALHAMKPGFVLTAQERVVVRVCAVPAAVACVTDAAPALGDSAKPAAATAAAAVMASPARIAPGERVDRKLMPPVWGKGMGRAGFVMSLLRRVNRGTRVKLF
jgi:hypothetical protein